MEIGIDSFAAAYTDTSLAVSDFQMNAASLPHAKIMRAIEAIGDRVIPAIRNSV